MISFTPHLKAIAYSGKMFYYLDDPDKDSDFEEWRRQYLVQGLEAFLKEDAYLITALITNDTNPYYLK